MELTKEQVEAVNELINYMDFLQLVMSKPYIKEMVLAVKSGDYKTV